jgi:hypothetical protein
MLEQEAENKITIKAQKHWLTGAEDQNNNYAFLISMKNLYLQCLFCATPRKT